MWIDHLERAQEPLRRHAAALLRDRRDADDLVRACLSRALERMETLNPQTDARTWLLSIMHGLLARRSWQARLRRANDPSRQGSCTGATVCTPPAVLPAACRSAARHDRGPAVPRCGASAGNTRRPGDVSVGGGPGTSALIGGRRGDAGSKMTAPERPISEDELQAWVDDRLDAARRLEVDRYLATQPDLARRMAGYRAQRDGFAPGVRGARRRTDPARIAPGPADRGPAPAAARTLADRGGHRPGARHRRRRRLVPWFLPGTRSGPSLRSPCCVNRQ